MELPKSKFPPNFASRRGSTLISTILWCSAVVVGVAAGVLAFMASNAQEASEALKWELVEIYEEHAQIDEEIAQVKAATAAAQREVEKELEKTDKMEGFLTDSLKEFGFNEAEIAARTENLTD